jgi:outer membrane protein TolC
MKTPWLFLLFSAAALGQTAGPAPDPAQTIDLDEAVKLALESHPDVGKAKAASEILKGKIREVRAQALPEIAVNGGWLRMRDPSFLNSPSLDKFPKELLEALNPTGANLFNYTLSVKQPLYTAGKVGTALKLASVEAEGAMSEIDRARQDLALNVVKAFYGLMWAERYVDLVAETQRQRKAHLDMARTRFQNGVATEVDVLRSEVAAANIEPDLVRAQAAVRQARALLNYYLVRPIDFPTRAAGQFEEKLWDEFEAAELEREAIRRRPEMDRLRVAERSSGVMLDLAKAESRMRADFASDYGMMSRLPKNLFSDRFIRWSFGVNFTLPVFDGFRRSGMVSQAVATQRAARLEREKLEQQVRLALQQGLDEVQAARETVEAARANVRQAGRVLEMMQANYQHGAATTLDVVDAQTALSLARTNLLRGLHDSSVARAGLRWTLGRTPWE